MRFGFERFLFCCDQDSLVCRFAGWVFRSIGYFDSGYHCFVVGTTVPPETHSELIPRAQKNRIRIMYRVIGGIGPPGWGPNAQKDLIQREFWGLGSIPA